MSEFFVTGTDTGIGKTLVSALITQHLGATYWKPVQSGLAEETDTQWVQRILDLPQERICREQFRLTQPRSPHESAEIDSVSISLTDFKTPDYKTDHLVAEGAGGVLVPLNQKEMVIDLMSHLKMPAIIVTRGRLGTLNHTFLTLEALRRRSVPVAGIVISGPVEFANIESLTHIGDVPLIGHLSQLDTIDADTLKQQAATFDWSHLKI